MRSVSGTFSHRGFPLLLTCLALSCSEGDPNGGGARNSSNVTTGTGANGASGGVGAQGGAQNGSGAQAGTINLVPLPEPPPGGSGGSYNPGNGATEVCDGIDNNANGIVDDVDAGHDGVCDCLNIATIGDIGPWSSGGNIFAKWLNERSPKPATVLGDAELTAEALKGIQIIVVLHADTSAATRKDVSARAHHAFSPSEVTVFGDWVRAGGGAMTTIGYTPNEHNEVINVNRLLAPLGLGYSNTKTGLDGLVEKWTPHPISAGVMAIRTDNGVEPETKTGTTVAYRDTQVALQVADVGSGRLAVWGDEWVTYDSEWLDLTGQQVEVFWLNLLKWLSPPTQCQVPIPPPRVR